MKKMRKMDLLVTCGCDDITILLERAEARCRKTEKLGTQPDLLVATAAVSPDVAADMGWSEEKRVSVAKRACFVSLSVIKFNKELSDAGLLKTDPTDGQHCLVSELLVKAMAKAPVHKGLLPIERVKDILALVDKYGDPV